MKSVALVLSVAAVLTVRAALRATASQGLAGLVVAGAGAEAVGGQYASAPANYNFQWDVDDTQSGNYFGHGEESNNGVVQGKYYVRLPDTRLQMVEYTADDSGYNPVVTYEGQAQFGGGKGSGGSSGQGGGYYP